MRQFARFVWFVLVYDVLVVLWGAYVRVSFSGDGCGAHWPLCNGETRAARAADEDARRAVPPRDERRVARVRDRSLRMGASRRRRRAPSVRRWTAWVLFFTASEALIGAAIVLLRLVAHDKSLVRGVSTSLHLTNTFLLLASVAITTRVAIGRAGDCVSASWLARWPRRGRDLRDDLRRRNRIDRRARRHALSVALGRAGSRARRRAVGALVHPLALAPSVRRRLRRRHAPRARVVCSCGSSDARRARARSRALDRVLRAGRSRPLNIRILAPAWLQLTHLLSADVVWVLLVLLATAALGEETPTSSPKAALAGSPPAR